MKPQFGIRSNLPLAAIVVSFAGIIQSAQAATDTWSGATDDWWDTFTSNWTDDGSDTLFNSGNDALFTGTPANNVTTATGLTIGAITLDNTFTGTVTLTGANTVAGPTTIQGGVLSYSANNQLGASAITLDGGTLNPTITTNTTITNSHVITVGAGGGTIRMTNTSPTGTPTFIMGNAGNLTGSGALTLKGGGSLVHGVGATDLVLGTANATFTGSVTIQDGAILEYANAGGVGAASTFAVGSNGELSTLVNLSNAVTVGSGGTLAFQNNNNGVFSGPITLNGNASIRMRDWYVGATRSGTISNTITGAHTLSVNSGVGLDLGTGGTLTLAGFDAKASSADIVLNSASLAINSGSGTPSPSVTRANSLTINTGNLTVAGVAGQNTNDVFGTLNLGGGSAGNLQGYSTWTLAPNAATNTMLTLTTMGTRTAGSWVAIAGTVGATPGAGTGNIIFTNAPSGANLIGAGGALGSGTASVIPWMHDTGGGAIYGYDATNGVASVTTVNVSPNLATAGQNINFNAVAPTLTADRSVNSYQMGFSSNNLGGFTLTVDSGVITADNANFTNGTLNFGTAEGQIQVHQARQLNIAATITGSGGATFYGFRPNSGNKGTAILSGANTYTGVTNMYGYGAGNNFVLFLTHSLALQNTTLNYLAGRASNLSFGNGGTSGQAAYTFGGLSGNLAINLNNNNTTVGPVALTVGGNNESTTYSGVLSSTVAGGSLTKVGSGTLTLTGVNTYTGDTTVTAGVLAINGTAIADTAKLVISGGQVAVTGVETVTALTLGGTPQGAGTYNSSTPGGFITGSGSIQVLGGYTTWAATNAGGQAPNLDFDNDGTSNGIEYFMGATGSSFTANPGIVGNKVTWPKDPAFSGSYTVQTSPDLATWTNVASTVVGNAVEYTVPTGQDKFFVRLNVTPN
jgi:fibronectin-binding autotransporter adhesin